MPHTKAEEFAISGNSRMEADPDSMFETETKCQIFSLPNASLPAGVKNRLLQVCGRIRRMSKRRYLYLRNVLAAATRIANDAARGEASAAVSTSLKSGDVVRIRSRKEIQSTLNNWNQLKGCAFMEEMWPYCGSQQKVLRTVKTFLDERDYSTRKCKGIVVLEGLICEGTKDFGSCDRSCHFFWREEWLEKIDVC